MITTQAEEEVSPIRPRRRPTAEIHQDLVILEKSVASMTALRDEIRGTLSNPTWAQLDLSRFDDLRGTDLSLLSDVIGAIENDNEADDKSALATLHRVHEVLKVHNSASETAKKAKSTVDPEQIVLNYLSATESFLGATDEDIGDILSGSTANLDAIGSEEVIGGMLSRVLHGLVDTAKAQLHQPESGEPSATGWVQLDKLSSAIGTLFPASIDGVSSRVDELRSELAKPFTAEQLMEHRIQNGDMAGIRTQARSVRFSDLDLFKDTVRAALT